MAFSSSMQKSDLQGTTKVEYWTWSAAGVTGGTIQSGIKNILHLSHNNEVSEDLGKWAKDSNGLITLTGVTSNDTGTLKVEGF